MKNRRKSLSSNPIQKRALAAAAWFFIACIITGTKADAQTLGWDPTQTQTFPGGGGNGNWDQATKNWVPIASGTDVVWVSKASAVFSGSAGTVTITGGGQTAGGITFDTSGYTITGQQLTLNSTLNSLAVVSVTTGSAAISSNIRNLNGFTVAGSGTLNLLSNTTIIGGDLAAAQGGLVISGTATDFNGTIANTGTAANVVVSGSWGNSGALTVGGNAQGTLFVGSIGLTANLTSASATIADQAGSTFSVAIVGGNGSGLWTNTGTLTVGNGDVGSLQVLTTGTVQSGNAIIANNSGSGMSNARVSGNGAAWLVGGNGDLIVGNNDVGALTINQGGFVSSTTGEIANNAGSANSVAIVGGNGSGLWTNTGTLIVGNSDAGSLNVLTTGTVQSGNGIIANATGFSTVLVSGSGAAWTLNQSGGSGDLIVGNHDTGELTINQGGLVSSTTAEIANNIGSANSLAIVGGSGSGLWTNTGNLIVGNSNAGSLQVLTTGTVQSGNAVIANSFAGSSSSALVSGNGAAWALNQAGGNGDLIVGNNGLGTLTINQGGFVSSTTAEIANSGLSAGSLAIVGGSGSGLWTNTGTLIVGNSNAGSLQVLTTGTVQSGNGIIANATGFSTVLVSGSGAAWTLNQSGGNGDLIVGNHDTGELTINQGGFVSSTTAEIANNAGSGGSLAIVGGSGSGLWTNTGMLVVGNNDAGFLQVLTTGTVQSGNAVIANSFAGSSSSALVSGSGAAWALNQAGGNGDLIVGNNGLGTLTINQGGFVSSTTAEIANSGLSAGSFALVGGSGSGLWTNTGTLIVGSGDVGSLQILTTGTVQSGNGIIGNFAGSGTSSVLVSGSGATWALNQAGGASNLTVGNNGNGMLDIKQGGVVTALNGVVSVNPVANGAVLVNGPGSSWNLLGNLVVASGGNGTLSVLNGGIVRAQEGVVGSLGIANGNVLVDGPGSKLLLGDNLSIGSGAHGAMTVQNLGSASVMNTLTVGAGSGFNNLLTIQTGGRVTGQNGVVAGNAGSKGSVSVNGMGSSWKLTGNLTVASSGIGSLSVQNGGVVSALEGVVSRQAGAIGTVLVDGIGSSLTIGDALNVGVGGQSAVTVQNFGSASVTKALTVGASSAGNQLTIQTGGTVKALQGIVGANAASAGMVTVSGFGSSLALTTNLTVGSSGVGFLTVQNAGRVSALDGVVGANAGSNGTVVVNGPLSNLALNTSLSVGQSGFGFLTVTGGGLVTTNLLSVGDLGNANGLLNITDGLLTANTAVIGSQASSVGVVNLHSGGLGKMTINGDLIIGQAGKGVENVTNGDVLKVGNSITVGNAAGSKGALTVINGGQANAGNSIVVGSQAGSFGSVFVGDPGSSLTTGQTLTVGNLGGGSLQIEQGGKVAAPATIIGLQGMVQNDAVLNSPNVTVFGVLGGTGVVNGNIINRGVVGHGQTSAAPLGALTVAGNYDQSPQGTLSLRIAGAGPGQSDSLFSTGSASLAGSLNLIRLNGFQLPKGKQIVLLSANGGISGVFQRVTDPFATSLLTSDIFYFPREVVLELAQGSFMPLAKTPNQRSVARNLDNASADPREAALVNYIDSLSPTGVRDSLDRISPDQLDSMFEISRSLGDVQSANIQQRLDDVRGGATGFSSDGLAISDKDGSTNLMDKNPVPAPYKPLGKNVGLFLTGNGEFVNVDSDGNARGYNFTTGGMTLGMDYRVKDYLVVGIYGGYANTSSDLAQGGRVDVNSGKGGLYASAYDDNLYLDLVTEGGYNSFSTSRASINGLANGETSGGEFTGLIGGGYNLHSGSVTFGPTLALQGNYASISSFTEHGSLSPLHIPSQSEPSLRTRLGVKISVPFRAVGGVSVTPQASVSWQHEYLNNSYGFDSQLASGAGTVFTVQGPHLGADRAVLNLGVNVRFNPAFSMYVFYNGEAGGQNYLLNSVNGGFEFTF